MRRHFLAQWGVWVLLAVIAVVANEIIDRIVWDERHTDGDILVAIAVVAIAFFGSYLIARRSSPARGVAPRAEQSIPQLAERA